MIISTVKFQIIVKMHIIFAKHSGIRILLLLNIIHAVISYKHLCHYKKLIMQHSLALYQILRAQFNHELKLYLI
jgi:hypothetical protein